MKKTIPYHIFMATVNGYASSISYFSECLDRPDVQGDNHRKDYDRLIKVSRGFKDFLEHTRFDFDFIQKEVQNGMVSK